MAAKAGGAGPPKLVNVYNLRTVATARPCSMCGKDTVKCLANQDVTDFLYCCVSHLSDPGFAKPLAADGTTTPTLSSPSAAAPKVSQEDIDRVKKEYEEKQAKKAEKEKKQEPASSNSSSTWLGAGLATGWSVAKTGAKALSETVTPLFSPPVAEDTAAAADKTPKIDPTTAKTFALHRHVFQLRVDQARRKWQAKQAASQSKEAIERISALELPSVPATPIGPPSST